VRRPLIVRGFEGPRGNDSAFEAGQKAPPGTLLLLAVSPSRLVGRPSEAPPIPRPWMGSTAALAL